LAPFSDHLLDRLRLFAQPSAAPTPAQIAFIDDYVGTKQKLSPNRLRAFLEFCGTLDRWGVATWENRTYFKIPTALKRTFWHGGRRFAKKALGTLIAQRSSTPWRI
jgi:hypothetical protein